MFAPGPGTWSFRKQPRSRAGSRSGPHQARRNPHSEEGASCFLVLSVPIARFLIWAVAFDLRQRPFLLDRRPAGPAERDRAAPTCVGAALSSRGGPRWVLALLREPTFFAKRATLFREHSSLTGFGGNRTRVLGSRSRGHHRGGLEPPSSRSEMVGQVSGFNQSVDRQVHRAPTLPPGSAGAGALDYPRWSTAAAHSGNCDGFREGFRHAPPS